MAVHALKNQYRGINAHLHSQLLHNDDWMSFHLLYISDMTKLLRQHLRNSGYLADLRP